MLSISVKVTGLDLFPAQPEVRDAIGRSLLRSGEVIKLRAQANLSGRFVGVRSGKLLRGFKPLVLREQGQAFVVTVKNTVWYGNVLEGGAAAHVIPKVLRGKVAMRRALARQGRTTFGERRPGEAAFLRGERPDRKVLRFEIGGKVIFARQVVHPGLRPRRWFASAVTESLPDLQRIFEQEFGAVVTKQSVVLA